ncbi:threonine ammonia-lyase [Roseiterribacter gracilis]|uniref:Serine/threonine dehydratase n=1 Tax=Roseiterribacter gracilis TaxID=2812848 RepID=A0A8S8X8N0_9PROT|nr:serine/threonine dehydratase [Rhodospirillales bacterium TMPK1]
MTAPTIADIQSVRAQIAPYILETPVHRWDGRERDARFEGDVVVKLELFQHTGTFKPRGALSNALSLQPDALQRGITAVSAGNHAIAAAYAAHRLGVSAKVVMLASANPARVQRAKAYGAEVVMAPDGKSAFELAGQIERDEGRAFIHPFEGHRTALGTATIAAEWHEQAPDLDAIIVPIGGGGLMAGIAAATKLLALNCQVFGVEPEGADTMHRSFAAGEPVSRSDVATIADSLAPPYALPYSFDLCRRNVDELVMINDDQIRDAMGVLFREMKLAVEPSGAAATAALFGPLRDRLRGKRVGVIACGANIDIAGFAKHIGAAQEASGLL